MLTTFGWVVKTWLKITIGLAIAVGGVRLWVWITDKPTGYVVAAIILAALADLWVIKMLFRQWVYEVEVWCWWWPK
jgi:membrane protein YdbS with pleckstrin-like domain